jgi:hypothetical protein
VAPANVVTNPVVQFSPDGMPIPNPAFDAAGRALPGNKSRVDDSVLRLFNAYQDLGSGWASAEPDDARALQVDGSGRVMLRFMANDVAALEARLALLGFEGLGSEPALHETEGWLPIASLPAAAALADQGLSGIEPVLRPQTAVGSTTSQADWVMSADRVRAALPAGYDGTGVRVGVLSDSYNNLGGAAADVASGDLPNNVQVVQDLGSGGADEGRAMCQLVHDVAPGAGEAFASAFISENQFATNITRLADPAVGNCKVIADDVFYYDEPYFQPGVVAQAVQSAYNTRGVTYFSSAGNQADQAWESLSPTTVSTTVAGIAGNWYDFDPGTGTDVLQRVTISNGGFAQIGLQWDQPFYTANGVTSDIDIFLIRSDTGAVVASSTSSNPTTQMPWEFIGYGNNTGQTNFDIAIRLFSGPNVGRLKYKYYGNMSVVDFPTNSPTISSHAGIPEAVGVAAVPYYNQRTRESYTSSGPMTILFGPTGNRLGTPIVSPGPLIAAPDGTNTTFFGSDIDGDGKPNFFGTSAAAPHAAAVAALIRQAYPALGPAEVYQRLVDSADTNTDAAGFDKYTGFGLIDAYRAIFGTTPVNAGGSVPETFDSGVLGPEWETYSTGPGRVQVTASNGPLSGQQLILQESYGDVSGVSGIFGRNEATLHVNPNAAGSTGILLFSEKEFNDTDNPMPASWTISQTGPSNTDGVAFSVDGNTWFSLLSLTGANSTGSYQAHAFDLRAAAAAAGVALTNDTRIRFQQYGTNNLPNDGLAFDNASFGVNQAPAFSKGADRFVAEDAGPETVTGWATGINPGPAALGLEASQAVSFEIVSNTNPSLFAAGPAVASNGTLTFTPAANANGSATIGVRIKDNGGTAGGGVDTSAVQTFTITVNPVNDPPSFTKGADQTVLEDAGAQTVPNWATNISAGPADESGQTLTFLVSNTNNGLFSVQPAVSSTGTLTFTPAPNANGSATVTVQLQDNGGGTDTSAAQMFTITVNPVNDAPTFAKGTDPTVNEDSGSQILNGWATGISAGPADESGQTLTFVVSNTNNGLFSVQPAVGPTGTLTFTPAPDANGSATVTVVLQDSGGTANGGVDMSPAQTFTITVNPVNDAPSFVAGADVRVPRRAGAQTIPGWATHLSPGPANESGQSLSFIIVSNSNPGLFDVLPTVSSAGTLRFTPADATGTATIQVSIKDDGGTANGGADTSSPQTFTITVDPVGGDWAAPVLSGVETVALAYTAGQGPVPITAGLTVADADSPNLSGATVRIVADYAPGQDTLDFTDQNGISGTFDAAAGRLTLTGTASRADYEAALRSVAFESTAGSAASPRSIAFEVTDTSSKVSNTVARDVDIAPANPAGTVGFTSPTIAATEGTPLTVRVSRVGGTNGEVSVDYAAVDGTAVAGSDYTLAAGTLTWVDGDGADKTIPVTIPADGLSEGAETFRLVLTNLTVASAGQLDTEVTIAPSDPVRLTPQARSTTWTDTDGDVVTVKLGGSVGEADVYQTNGAGAIQEIVLSGTSSLKSTLTVSVKRNKLTNGDGRVGLGAVTGTGLKSLMAPTAILNGAGLDFSGSVGSIVLGSVRTGANIRVTGGLGKLTVNGNLAADVTVGGVGVPPTSTALGSLKVAGNILNSDIEVDGNIGTVQALGFTGSRLFAGPDGAGGFTGTVKTFTVTGIFADSNAFAFAFRGVTLRSVDSEHGGTPFGFTAHTFGKLKVTTPGFAFNSLNPATQGIDDFEVRVV